MPTDLGPQNWPVSFSSICWLPLTFSGQPWLLLILCQPLPHFPESEIIHNSAFLSPSHMGFTSCYWVLMRLQMKMSPHFDSVTHILQWNKWTFFPPKLTALILPDKNHTSAPGLLPAECLARWNVFTFKQIFKPLIILMWLSSMRANLNNKCLPNNLVRARIIQRIWLCLRCLNE